MVRHVTSMYNIWLAGYYDDFMGARAISDDFNTPSNTYSTGVYESTLTHFGNPMNGEATLNQRYRFSIADRDLIGSTHVDNVDSANQYLKNKGAFEWLSYDNTRQNAEKWEGRAQLQYPDGHIANRYAFNNVEIAGSNATDWLLFTNGNDTEGRYLVPTGDNDATFGRSNMKSYFNAVGATNYASKIAGKIDATGDFIQRAHLAGVWMGETLAFNASSTTPVNLFAPVSSPSGQPFLCVQTWRTAYNDSSSKPQLVYDGPLNSLLDGDIFTARVAVRAFNGTTGGTGVVEHGKVPTNLTFKIGYAASQKGTTSSLGFTGTPAITYVIDLSSASLGYDLLGLQFESTTKKSIFNDDSWLDVDFVLNYSGNGGAGTFDVYINGTLIASNQNMSGSPSAGDLYGYEIEAAPTGAYNSSSTTLMVDRVGLVRYLTDAKNYKSYDAPIQNMNISMPVNGVSNCKIVIADDPQKESGGTANLNVGMRSQDYLHNLKNIFSGDTPVDWSLLVFASQTPRIDRPVWRGIIDKMSIKQRNNDGRTITLNANDNLNLLDRQIPLWEVGQKSLSNNTETPQYWLYDAQGYRQIMNLGTLPLKTLSNKVGFDVDDSYLEVNNQRTQLGSGHPIQMYNNEDTVFGPNDLEAQYEGVFSQGFSQDTSGKTVINLLVGHGVTQGSTAVIRGSNNAATNGSYTVDSVTSLSATFSASDVPYVTPTAKIVYAGTYLGETNNESILARTSLEVGTSDFSSAWLAWRIAENGYNALPNSSSDEATSEYVTFFFDADPILLINDEFCVSDVTVGLSANTSYDGKHTVTGVKKIMNYYDTGTITNPFLWAVTTSTDYNGVEFVASGKAYTDKDGLRDGNDRKSISVDSCTIATTAGNFDKVKYKPLHARWMRDLPNSLWFKYHFGKINRTVLFKNSISANVSTGDNKVQIPQALYDSLITNYKSGIAQLSNGLGSTIFVYTGLISSGGNYYLVGCKYITKAYTTATSSLVSILDVSDDYKHLWLLWSDMRNNGRADADGSTRKTDFGLQYPTTDNYEVSLYYVDQTDTDGNIDKFANLKIGEDIDIWNVDATNEPVSGAAFSKTPNYSLGNPVNITYGSNQLVVSGLTDATCDTTNTDATITMNSTASIVVGMPVSGLGIPSGATVSSITNATTFELSVAAFLTTSNTTLTFGPTTTNYTVGSYATIYNSLHYDGTYEIASISGTSTITLKGVSTGTNTNAVIGNVMIAPAAASEIDLSLYRDWEDKAGAFIVIDSARFFNLNTLANKGASDQVTGRNTDLGDYVATVEGFPALIDNYYAEAISSYKNTAAPISPHPNNQRLISDLTTADEGLIMGDMGIPVESTANFDYTGTGLIVVDIADSDDTVEYYFAWKYKLDTAITGTGITITSYNRSQNITTTNPTNTVITKIGETFQTKGVKIGMVIKNTTKETRHNVLAVLSETQIVVSGTWSATQSDTDDYTLPVQLANAFLTTADHITSSIETSSTGVENEIWALYTPLLKGNMEGIGVNVSQRIAGDNPQADLVVVHNTVSSQFMLRLLMHVEGDVQSKNSGSFYDSDKFRLLWNAAIMKSWTPKTRLGTMFDINNVPITSLMTTYNSTSSSDGYGSIVDSRTKTILSTVEDARGKSGFGVNNGLKTTFSYLIGRDNRFEYRPKYNSGLIFTRENVTISDLNTDVAGQITNVRVYYNKGYSFVDYPNTSLTDTTRWTVLEYPKISSSLEARQVAKQKYNQVKNSRLSITVKPILENNHNNKMIESGRYGYIADPQLALQGYGDYDATDTNRGNSWTILGTGGVPFSGMTNGLDGNMKTSTDLYHRHGKSSFTHTSADVAWADNYYWYGSRSLSYAMQIVHIPNFTPHRSEATNEHLRVYVALKVSQAAGATIDDCQFSIYCADYTFEDLITKDATANQITSVDVKDSGFYELPIPAQYSTQSNAKIIVSFNAEYCRALLRHRCGDPTGANILKNANSIYGVNLSSSGFNTDSIFPLGGREYSEMYGGFTTARSEWYAPRIHITNDLSYTPATYLSFTDAGIGLSSAETLTIKSINWNVVSGSKEDIQLELERDESLSSGGILGFLFPNQGKTRQVSSSMTHDSEPITTPTTSIIPEGSTSSEQVQVDTSTTSEFGLTQSDNANGDMITTSTGPVGIGKLSKGAYGKLKGRMFLMNDNLSHNSKFSILGQQKPPKVPTLFKGIEGMDVDIQTASGNASITSDGYILAGKGRVDILNETATTTTFESTLQTEFIIPDDVVNNNLLITAKVSHGIGASTTKTAVLYTTAVIEETGETISNTIRVQTNSQEKIVELIPLNALNGVKAGNKITVKVTRKAATGDDNSDRNSVLLKSIKVKLNRASAPVSGTSNKFEIQ